METFRNLILITAVLGLALYSLEKLIEWKLLELIFLECVEFASLLAREIN